MTIVIPEKHINKQTLCNIAKVFTLNFTNSYLKSPKKTILNFDYATSNTYGAETAESVRQLFIAVVL